MKSPAPRIAIAVVVSLAGGWLLSSLVNRDNAETASAENIPKRSLGSSVGNWSGAEPLSFRQWFEQLKSVARSGELGKLSASARRIQGNAATKTRATAIARAAREEIAARGTAGSPPSIAAATEKDFKALVAKLATLTTPEDRDLSIAFAAYAARHPEEALKFAQRGTPEGWDEDSMVGTVLFYWALVDGEAAFGFAKSSGRSKFSLNYLLHVWAISDPKGAVAAIEPNRQLVAYGTGRGHSGWQPEKFLRLLIAKDPAAAENWFNAIGDNVFRNSLARHLIPELAVADPTRAMHLLDALPSGLHGYKETRDHLFERWAAADPMSLLTWIGEQQPSTDHNAAMGKALVSLATQSPQQAAEVLGDLQVPKKDGYTDYAYSKACEQVCQYMMESDRAATEEWLSSLSADVLEVALPAVYTSAWFTLPPDEAWDYVNQQPEDAAKATVLPQMVAERMRLDPKGGLRLLATIEEGATKEFAIRNTISELVKFDAPAAIEFAAGMGPSKTRDQVMQNLAAMIGLETPAKAIELCAEIADPKLRISATRRAINTMAQLDPDRALEVLDSLPDPASLDNPDFPKSEHLRHQITESIAMRNYLRN